MYDSALFLDALSRFARTLVLPYDVDDVLHVLVKDITAILSASACAVLFVDSDGKLRFASGEDGSIEEIERVQEEFEEGPCYQALKENIPVAVDDLAVESERWPRYVAAARDAGIVAVAGIPMTLSDKVVGALNVFDTRSRAWSEDVEVAQVLADIATGYIVNGDKFHQQQQLSGQLQHALEARVVIEQAKGIVAQANKVSVDAAYERMRRHARTCRASVRSIASEIVEGKLKI